MLNTPGAGDFRHQQRREAGDVVSVVLNGKTYTSTTDASGNWSVGVPAADVTALGSGAQTITASVSDRAGNSDDASRTVTVSLSAPVISINTIAGDDVINATEKGSDLTLSGTSDQPAGTAITVTLNGQNYSATTDASGNWALPCLPLLSVRWAKPPTA
ncbi:hypothetical protein ECZU34_34090 [Escherichia coli]|nr:hypothetical protein ECZU34_34090 [Escherichia coli]